MPRKGFDLAALAREAMGGDAGVSNLDTALLEVPAEKITPNEANFYEMSELEDLAASIELTGLLHPVLVKPAGEGYVILDGERRFRALTEILGRNAVPCLVRRPVNDVIEELMLIESNRTQRKMSAADLSKQAERYMELLSGLKNAGIEIPGRLRDRVAEALDVSASKLGRLSAIRNRLDDGLLVLFDRGTLNESVAYELSKVDHLTQLRVWDNLTRNMEPSGLNAEQVRQAIDGEKQRQKTPAQPVNLSGGSFDVKAYLEQRQDEDDDFFLLLNEVANDFFPVLDSVYSRQEGILTLKETFGKVHRGSGCWNVDWDAEPKGLTLQSSKRKIKKILRTWTEVYDSLCTIALNRAAISVSNLDTGLVWHRCDPDHLPPDSGTIILWGPGGLHLTPQHLVKETLRVMPESVTHWAVVSPPKEILDGH